MDKDDVIATLNTLVETCKDGEYGFGSCAEHAQQPALQQEFLRRAALCAAAAAELQALVTRLGGSAQDSGSASAAVHRGWVAICAQLADSTDLALLEACEQGDDQALERYRSALADDLPAGVLHLVQQQYDGAKACHAHLRQLRDAARSAATS